MYPSGPSSEASAEQHGPSGPPSASCTHMRAHTPVTLKDSSQRESCNVELHSRGSAGVRQQSSSRHGSAGAADPGGDHAYETVEMGDDTQLE